jgi:RNA polymerase sigma-70 factor (ECF subfamily)
VTRRLISGAMGRYPGAVSSDDSMTPAMTSGGEGQSLERLILSVEANYDLLLGRLAAALHSRDSAADALHDAFLKLKAGAAVSEVRNPLAYLFRMSINLARNRLRRETLYVPAETAKLDDLVDDTPGPERHVGASQLLERAHLLLSALPAQRRAIFLSRWRDDKSLAEIAVQFALHKRTIQKELERAERHLRMNLLDR